MTFFLKVPEHTCLKVTPSSSTALGKIPLKYLEISKVGWLSNVVHMICGTQRRNFGATLQFSKYYSTSKRLCIKVPDSQVNQHFCSWRLAITDPSQNNCVSVTNNLARSLTRLFPHQGITGKWKLNLMSLMLSTDFSEFSTWSSSPPWSPWRWTQTWNLSKYLHDQIFVCKNFTHWKRVNRDYFRQQ